MFKKITFAICCIPLITFAGFSSFKEVHDVVFSAAPGQISTYDDNALPHYKVDTDRFYRFGENLLKKSVIRTTSDDADIYPYFEKLLHANGVCFSGKWEITETTNYTGYFKKDSTALLIARASTALSETERGAPRAFAFAGKLFPTDVADKKVHTENFFVLDVLAGADRDHYLGIQMTNKPETGFRFDILPLAFQILKAFNVVKADHNLLSVKPIGEIDLTKKVEAKAPKFMMLVSDKSNQINEEVDFRNELDIQKHHPHGLTFKIMVNDTTDDRSSSLWKKIGNLVLEKSIVSYGCDLRLHFSHKL